jgi:HSP20 family protein
MTLPAINVDALLSDALRSFEGSGVWSPPCNAYEDEHGFWVQAALPGMDRKDIQLTLEDSVLTVKGQRQEENHESRRYFTHEIDTGMFSRSFRLPANVEPNKVVASYKEGVLTIQLPKREEAKPRQISIS